MAPSDIVEQADQAVFIFGSNTCGEHGEGAAKVAHDQFGADWGVGEGLTGRTDALPTMEGEQAFHAAVTHFLGAAASLPQLTFLLTKVVCGSAGYDEGRMQHWFGDAPENARRPPGW